MFFATPGSSSSLSHMLVLGAAAAQIVPDLPKSYLIDFVAFFGRRNHCGGQGGRGINLRDVRDGWEDG